VLRGEGGSRSDLAWEAYSTQLAPGAAGGALWGGLIGLLFLASLLGAAIGATAGGVAGAVTDPGIDDRFMKELGESLPPGRRGVVRLVRKVTPDKVIPRMGGYGGRVIQSSLSSGSERRLPGGAGGERRGGLRRGDEPST
jgi:uncharacterized membrane protein